MADEVVYKNTGYNERLGCYLVDEYRNGARTYTFKAYIKGNKATLYPYRPVYTTRFKRDKIELSVFDLK